MNRVNLYIKTRRYRDKTRKQWEEIKQNNMDNKKK